MTMKRTTVAALAVALGIGAVGTAHAIMIDGSETSVTYAKETLPDAGKVTVDGVTYYQLGRDLPISGDTKIYAQSGDRYFVTYTLQGMVLGGAITKAQKGALSVATGGSTEDSSVTFRLTTDGAITADEAGITVDFPLAVSAQGGTITREIVNESFPTTSARSETNTVLVMVKSALKETVKVPTAAVAKAVSNFTDFGSENGTGDPLLTATLGTLTVGVMSGTAVDLTKTPPVKTDTRYRDAKKKAAAAAVDLSDIMVGSGKVKDDSTDNLERSTVSVAGDVSFVKKIGFGNACTNDYSDIRKMATAPATGYTDEIEPQLISGFTTTTSMALCVEVDGETAIPAASYTATTKYGKLGESAFGPVGGTHTIGEITRDGTTVQIPYLTTWEGYNQRLVLRNRGNREVSYTIAFTTEDGVTADPESVTDTLMAGEFKTMKVGDMTTLSGGSRAAATLTSTAAQGRLGVATTLVNLQDRSTDTETHGD